MEGVSSYKLQASSDKRAARLFLGWKLTAHGCVIAIKKQAAASSLK
jgi:hypothetical protein